MTKLGFKILLLILLLSSNSCKTQMPIQQKSFPNRNIPEHNFQFGINRLKDTIVSLFTFGNQYENNILSKVFYNYNTEDSLLPVTFNAETSGDALFGKNYFSKLNTSDDIYLHDFGEAWISKLYYSGSKPLEYFTAFVVKLTRIDAETTKVQIVAEEPKVFNGISGYGPHGAIARESSVNPTSIEEYILLMFIADKLGDKTMLPLKLPADK